MKAKILCSYLILLLLSTSIFAQEFGYPVEGEAWYFIKINFSAKPELKSDVWKISRIFVNDNIVRNFFVYQKKKELFDKKIKCEAPFDLKIRYSWSGDREYTVKVILENINTGKDQQLEKKIQSPSTKGYWDPDWKNYLTLVVSEENKFKRINYPIHATFGILGKYFHSINEIRVVKTEKKNKKTFYKEIPCQVYDVVPWEDLKLLAVEEKDEETGIPITRYHPTTTLSIAFLADLKPHEKASFLVFYNNPGIKKPSYETDLEVAGEGLGKIIENSFYRVVLDKKSGMVLEINEKKSGLKLEHKLETNGAIHWNPGAYSPPHAWSHCSDWEDPPFTENIGPVFYSLHRAAPLPHVKDVLVSIDYYFYRESPFIIMESAMQITNDIFVKALRNGEIVFSKQVLDRSAYKTLRGKTEIIDFADTRKHPEHVAVLDPETPWITFFNEKKHIALANLFLDHKCSNIYGGGASMQQPYIYIQHGPWYYISRAFVYSFGSNNQTRMLPVKKGSIYADRNAWLPYSFKNWKDCEGYIDKYFNTLKYPLHITEVMETFPDSPEGWLTPILTEPFEEGVEGAIGKKRKKK